MVQLPRAPSVSGKRIPISCAASWSVARITPASATASRSSALIERIRFMRRIERSSAEPSAGGVAPAGHAGIAALRHQRHAMLGGEPDDLGDLVGRCRSEHRRRRAVDAPAPVGQPRLDLLEDR